MTVAVMAAGGNSGRRIAELLLRRGERVRALGRSAARLAALARAGAHPCVGAPDDVAFLADAFRGADAVYALLACEPATPDCFALQRAQSEAIVRALRASGVRCVVSLGSLGAEQASGTGPIASLHEHEARLRDLGGAVDVLVLRAAPLFDNFRGALARAGRRGVADAVAPDLDLPMVGTRDIADVAVRALAQRDWRGWVVRELLGPHDLSWREATRIVGECIGRPGLAYVQLGYDELARTLQRDGWSRRMACLRAEWAQALNEGRVQALEGRHAGNSTSMRFEEYAAELARQVA